MLPGVTGLSDIPMALDVCCGRGDLTLGLARRHPALRVVGVDSSESSLAAARGRAAAARLANVRFVLLDESRMQMQLAGGARSGELAAALDEGGENQLDLVLALRACGGLADAALSLASSRAASALVLPCCYAKHGDLCPADAHWRVPDADRRLLCQMADGGDEADPLAVRARVLVGCLRLAAAARRRPATRMGIRRAPAAVAAQGTAVWVEECT